MGRLDVYMCVHPSGCLKKGSLWFLKSLVSCKSSGVLVSKSCQESRPPEFCFSLSECSQQYCPSEKSLAVWKEYVQVIPVNSVYLWYAGFYECTLL